MIPIAIALALIFSLPGNLLWFAMCLMFCVPDHKLKERFRIDLPQKFMLLWFAWAFVSCCLSSHRMEAFIGTPIRMEGWFMWLIMIRLAWMFWLTCSFEKLTVPIVVATMFYLALSLFCHQTVVHWMAVSAFFSLVFVLAYSVHWMLPIVVAPFLMFSGARSAVLAVFAGIFFHFVNTKEGELRRVFAPIILVFVLLMSPIIMQKMASLEVSGVGARTHWMLQAYSYSWDRPFFGYGLENLAFYLTNTVSGFVPSGIPDKTHNIFFDMIMMTGWGGFVLFLLSMASAVAIAIRHRTERNMACASVVVAWLAFGMFNPHGCAATVLMLICLFGINRYNED